MVSGGDVSMTASKTVDISGGNIAMSTDWGGMVKIDPRGSEMIVDNVFMAGSQIRSDDRLSGMTLRSEDDDVEIAAGRMASMRGQSVNLMAEQDIQMVGRSVELA